MSDKISKELRQACIDLLQADNARTNRSYSRVIPNLKSAVKHINEATKLYRQR